ncbi:MAG: hypothetical protein CFE28_14570 [Alphaproteobacteria bacterium PA2]|nr:MAG: hypothetical protein CFE28_14570 [Alphaproteobacteria bacterium PA2]
MSILTPTLRLTRASDEAARDLAGRVGRFLLVALGLVIMAVGLVTAPLPGHLGLPILVVGLMVVLRNSFKARRRFVRMQRAHPKMIFPLRRLMRREPEVVLVIWQQFLRVERIIPNRKHRILVKARRAFRRHSRKPAGPSTPGFAPGILPAE